MALIKCSECEKEISDKAGAYPHCGFKMHRKKNINLLIGLSILLVAVILFVIFMFIYPTHKAKTISINTLAKYLNNPSSLECADIKVDNLNTLYRIKGKYAYKKSGFQYDEDKGIDVLVESTEEGYFIVKINKKNFKVISINTN